MTYYNVCVSINFTLLFRFSRQEHRGGVLMYVLSQKIRTTKLMARKLQSMAKLLYWFCCLKFLLASPRHYSCFLAQYFILICFLNRKNTYAKTILTKLRVHREYRLKMMVKNTQCTHHSQRKLFLSSYICCGVLMRTQFCNHY